MKDDRQDLLAGVSCRSTSIRRAEQEAFGRVVESRNRTFALLANAARSGFDAASPELSRLVLDACADAVARGATREEQFESCFAVAYRVLGEVSGGAPEGAAGSLLVTCIEGTAIYAQWIGPDEAWLVKKGAPTTRTQGHFYSGPGVTERGVPTRAIGPDYGEPTPDSLAASWQLEKQTRLVLMSRSVIRSAGEDVICQVAASQEAQDAADALTQLVNLEREAYAVALAIERRTVGATP
jgi:hypothetical protein